MFKGINHLQTVRRLLVKSISKDQSLSSVRGSTVVATEISCNLNFKSTLLKTVDTIGNSQRLVFSLGVSQHMHKLTNL